MTKYVLMDSGNREHFRSGMVRDIREGKGRYDLISPYALKRLADVYERGCQKYDDRNWEKGAPFCRFLDSALRHIEQYLMREGQEDHLAQAAWNLFAVMHFEETGRADLDDRPDYRRPRIATGTMTAEEIFKRMEVNETTHESVQVPGADDGRNRNVVLPVPTD